MKTAFCQDCPSNSTAGSIITHTVSLGSYLSHTAALAETKRSWIMEVSAEVKYDGQSRRETKTDGPVFTLRSNDFDTCHHYIYILEEVTLFSGVGFREANRK